ncbi:putative phage abortive infection protein [[Flexibacter] sp. ATCC 35208]|uniref:putative phage abortive infection protein n=1 Tax=[Flexibacter] sp. ATCC 35208 TaxID=1936242 RepID=UPI0009D50CDD|nr:putative phage abortive infection protein [[Flexibacter] sp. ATCC 35208]OMP74667.1 hypothetical protein BW716_34150 [[Flexibacter] sp. ATCC 35208]
MKITWGFVLGAFIVLGLLAGAIYLPYYFVHSPFFNQNFCESGQIGDSIGGTVGPAVAIIGALLTFLAFYVQYQANQQQKADLKQQREDWEIERFETRFFELLKLHKENVSEMELVAGKIKGKLSFNYLFEEFICLYKQVNKLVENSPEPDKSNLNAAKITYLVFYYGVGKLAETSYIPEFSWPEYQLFEDVKKSILQQQQDYIYPSKSSWQWAEYQYMPYNGHSTMLGTYYRHLFQTSKYIITFPHIKDPEVKYQYIRTMRDQLSEFEQLMLYFNATTWFPKEWEEAFTSYRFIKNIPLQHIPEELSPIERYQEFMIKLWLTKKKRLFEVQGDIDKVVNIWIDSYPEIYITLKIHPGHKNYPSQSDVKHLMDMRNWS